MPKNHKSGGSRAPKNYDPRYSERKKATKQGIGRSHRGYQAPTEAEAPQKSRWSAADRAGRDHARGIQDNAAGRPSRDTSSRFDRNERGDLRDRNDDRGNRNERFAGSPRGDRNERFNGADRNERPRYNRDDRGDRYNRDDRPRQDRGDRDFGRSTRPARDGERPRTDRERPVFRDGPRSRFQTDDRGARDGERRFNRDDRPAHNRTDRKDRPAFRDDRGARDGERRFNRDDRPAYNRDNRASFNRDDRAPRDGERRFDRSERPSFNGGERPRYNRDERPARGRDERPSYNRDDRPARAERPSFNRDERPARAERPSFRDERPARAERPSFRDERPARAERPSFRDERPRGDRSDWNKNDSKKSFDDHEDIVRERLAAKAVSADDVSDITFGALGLGENIVNALNELGAAKPFPIQAATIPDILAGRDTLGRGRTGSGKTIAFGAPVVEALLRSRAGIKREFGRKPSAIILAPTRELALQIDRTIQPIARSVGLFTTQIYGGVPQGRQVGALQKGVDIIIGTPGRIEDLIEQRKLDLSEVKFAVLDEADHMCELGFLEPVQRILRKTQDGSQKLLFSATLDAEVEALVNEFLVNPAVYEVAGEDQDSGTIEHRVLVVEHREKADILTSLVDRAGKTLVFTRTRAYAEMLTEQFEDAGIPAVALHGDLNQAKRTRNLQRMTSGRVDVLVATDVAARGIHVDDIDLVVQADAPDEYKTYMHRSGRTGRAGNSGRVVTLIPRQRRRRMTELLDRAEIEAPFDEARAGDDVIDEITGRSATLEEITA
ncbi:DEAD/DEAH box helicase [Microbacterium sp. NC79]|uniref:DEAD/DEAH box helicase n=1 Tax=Microbacterium sp. NC79 TaxID=2851009 RepID=UPI001C2CA1AC|nr:DEAD/DEAH box helicase [Microbacterium sp. NC79]MBV0893773.1 DEAD/DEAH box helicase [Microbacterium sp. NC79]